MTITLEDLIIEAVLEHPQFVGLWTYRPHARDRQFSASVMLDGQVQETEMSATWRQALSRAADILELKIAGGG